MTFLNASLLLGSLAVIVPITLHLLGKREPRRVPFPAVRFLTQRLQSNRRRMQIKRWVLLAMRVALLALLALGLARPEIHRATMGQWLGIGGLSVVGLIVLGMGIWAVSLGRSAAIRWGLLSCGLALLVGAGGWSLAAIANGPEPIQTATAPVAVVLLFDNSATTSYQPLDEETRLDLAKEMARWIVGRYPSESRFAVLDRSGKPAAFAIDTGSVARSVNNLAPLQTTRPLGERVEAAVRLLRTSDLKMRSLFILTDLSETSWRIGGGGEWDRVAAEIAREPAISVQVVDVGSETYRNRRLQQVELFDPTPAKNVSSPISVLVEELQANEAIGSEMVRQRGRDLTVQVRMYESEPGLPIERDAEVVYPKLRTVDRKKFSASSAAMRVDLNLPPLDYGTHHGYIELVDPDPLALDNVRFFSVRVDPPRKILLVCDQASDRGLMTAILNPFGIEDPRREYEIEFATTATLRESDLSQFVAIGMFNSGLPSMLTRDALEIWVREGGRLFVSLGPGIDTSINDGGMGELVQWPLVGNPKRIWRVPEPGTFSQVMQSGHPSLNALASVPGGVPWGAFRVYQYWQLNTPQEFSELIRYAGTDHVALGERTIGAGRVMILTTPMPAITPPADRWNDLLSTTLSGTWDVYVILMQQIFEDLSGGLQTDLNVQVGQPVALSISAGAGNRYQLFAPSQPPVAVDSVDKIIVPGTPLVAGSYWLRGAGNELAGYSANLPTDATLLTRIDVDGLDKTLGVNQYSLVRDQEEIQLAEGDADESRPLYPLIMLVVAAIFFLEQLLANRFYPAGKTSSVKSTNSERRTGRKSVAAA